MKLISADIHPEPNQRGETVVTLTWETLLVSRHDWKALNAALDAGDIPRQTITETRSYATRELAEMAIATMGGKVAA